jgi:hypothetical protein
MTCDADAVIDDIADIVISASAQICEQLSLIEPVSLGSKKKEDCFRMLLTIRTLDSIRRCLSVVESLSSEELDTALVDLRPLLRKLAAASEQQV